MKKLMFLLVAGTMFVFTACNCDSCTDDCTEKCCAKDGAECADDCKKACCAADAVLCPNTGEPCLDDHSCCFVKSESTEEVPEDSH